MVHLMADGGATSVRWALIEEGHEVEYLRGRSLSPVYVGKEEALQRLGELFPLKGVDFAARVARVNFFGASCGPDQHGAVVEEVLKLYFPSAVVYVGSDMEIAARAVYAQGECGCVAILGTGSNAGYFDGAHLRYARPSLGYILGDEGSGAAIGMAALRDWLYGEMPSALSSQYEASFSQECGVRKGPDGRYITDRLVARVLGGEEGSAFVARFAKLVLQNLRIPYCHGVVHRAFTEFILRQLEPNLSLGGPRRVGAVGSVAWYGREVLNEVCEERGIELRTICPEPLEGAVSRELAR